MIDLIIIDGTVRAGIAFRSATPGFEAEHGSQPDLCLIWNDFSVDTSAIDVVLYFHGFALGSNGTPPLSTFVEVSGLFDDLAGVTFVRRKRPTLVVIPRGDGQPIKDGAWPYRFPATIENPNRVIALAISEMAEARRMHAPPGTAMISTDRLLLMAHSGGGLAVIEVLSKMEKPPTEIYLFDALYQNADALADWAVEALRRGDATARLWVGYLRSTEHFSEALATKLAKLLTNYPANLAARFRIESIAGAGIEHMGLPRAYAPQLLQNEEPVEMS